MAKILLIEKDELSCKLLQQQLKQKGYDVITATEGGDQGIVLAVTLSPDLILVGAELPKINGWQTTKILKESTVTQRIPVIFLTTPMTPAELAMISETNCDDYSLKPINIKSLLGKIEALLKGSLVATGVDTKTQDRLVNQQSRAQKAESQIVNDSRAFHSKALKTAVSTFRLIAFLSCLEYSNNSE